MAPVRLGPLQWLASDEDDAQREAETRALEAEWILADQAEVEGEAGEVDPVVAVEDALRQFPADEILIVGDPEEDGVFERALVRYGLPVSRLGPPPLPTKHPQLREQVRAIIGGRSRATPFVFFAGVNLTLLVLALLISALVLLIVWLL